ncbi:hypothetical protein [Paucibacter soli]|uniref:hypothetical protein n=1 Tax=Paucibacter soli TaxID=3133433 RepID=UPI0030A80E7E
METFNYTAVEILALYNRVCDTNEPGKFSPELRLKELFEDVLDETDEGTAPEAAEYIARKGSTWNGGGVGAIGVCVRKHEDGEVVVLWGSSDGYTWCNLDCLIEAIFDGNQVPDWYESEWVEVQDDRGEWVQRNVLAVREEEAKYASNATFNPYSD